MLQFEEHVRHTHPGARLHKSLSSRAPNSCNNHSSSRLAPARESMWQRNLERRGTGRPDEASPCLEKATVHPMTSAPGHVCQTYEKCNHIDSTRITACDAENRHAQLEFPPPTETSTSHIPFKHACPRMPNRARAKSEQCLAKRRSVGRRGC